MAKGPLLVFGVMYQKQKLKKYQSEKMLELLQISGEEGSDSKKR
jgi:hypothetical protein